MIMVIVIRIMIMIIIMMIIIIIRRRRIETIGMTITKMILIMLRNTIQKKIVNTKIKTFLCNYKTQI